MNSRKLIRAVLRLALGLAFGIFAGEGVKAQQAPDCNNCTCAMPSMLGVTLSTSTPSTQGPCPGTLNFPSFDPTRFGRFYGVVGRRYTLALCGETANTMIYIATNTSTPGVITCDDDGCGVTNGASQVSFIPTASALYRVYVFNGTCGNLYAPGTTMELTITCNPMPAPANDLPCNATPLAMGPICDFTAGSNVGATSSQSVVPGVGAPPSCTGALYQGADVWYSTTVPATGLIGIQTQEASLCAGAFQLYSGNCPAGTFTQLPGSCTITGLTGPNSEPATVFDAFAAGMVAGQTLYIRYWERYGNENGSFEICVFEAIPPDNDEPCGAAPLTLGTACLPATYSTENAFPLSTVTAPPVTAGCGGPAGNDLWFSFVVPTPVPVSGITVNTLAGSLNNMAMAWYRLGSGSICGPGALTQIGCNQNQTGANLMPRINSTALAPLVAGETIYVRVWSETPWVGTFQICAYENQTPPNDDPCGAIALTADYGCILQPFSNEAATQTNTTPPGATNVPNPSCGLPTLEDVWYTVTMPPNGQIQFDTQAGSMINAAMAVYRVVSGSCASGNLSLQQIAGACAVGGGQQGSTAMPFLNVNQAALAGQTLYVRVWRQTGTEGTFNMCAVRTDPPPGDCFYTLNMFDAAGDGWGGSYVTVCVDGNCSNYTVNGSQASVSMGANIGDVITVGYTAAGGFQNQNSYSLTQYGSAVYVGSSPPQQGAIVFSESVTCDPPPAPPSDCLGSTALCSTVPQVNQNPQNTGGVSDLNPSNDGCLLYENQGLWYSFTISQAGPLGFTIQPASGADYDFAIWGPFPAGTQPASVCPPSGPPIRCSWAAGAGATGLAINASLPLSEGAGGSGFVRHIDGIVGQVYILYIDNWSENGVSFSLNWAGTGGVDCTQLPIELLDFDARAHGDQVLVDWSTASEHNTAWFDVERSADGLGFQAIGRVNAAGFASQTTNYHFVDDAPLKGLSYYRLHAVDADGASTNSHAVPVLIAAGNGLAVHPNPTQDVLWLSVELKEEGTLRWRVLDMSGRLVQEGNSGAAAGHNLEKIAVADLDRGSYLLEVQDESGHGLGTARFVKQ